MSYSIEERWEMEAESYDQISDNEMAKKLGISLEDYQIYNGDTLGVLDMFDENSNDNSTSVLITRYKEKNNIE